MLRRHRDAGGKTDAGAFSVRYGVKVGTSTLTPSNGLVQAGQPLTFTLDWTHPRNWNELEHLHLRLRNTAGEVVFWARFDQETETFLLYDPASDAFVGQAIGATTIDNALATLDLAQSTVAGSGPTIGTFSVRTAAQAARRRRNVSS